MPPSDRRRWTCGAGFAPGSAETRAPSPTAPARRTPSSPGPDGKAPSVPPERGCPATPQPLAESWSATCTGRRARCLFPDMRQARMRSSRAALQSSASMARILGGAPTRKASRRAGGSYGVGSRHDGEGCRGKVPMRLWRSTDAVCTHHSRVVESSDDVFTLRAIQKK